MWRSHVKGPLGNNVSCISVDVQPPLRISDNLIPFTESREIFKSNCPISLLSNRQTIKNKRIQNSAYLSSELSGSKAISLFSNVPGATDSGAMICMGSSLKCGASFSSTMVTITVAVLPGRLGALLLRGFVFFTVRVRMCSFRASKSKGCVTKTEQKRKKIIKSHWKLLEKKKLEEKCHFKMIHQHL